MKKKILIVVNVDSALVSHRLPVAEAALAAGYEVHIATQMTQYGGLFQSKGFIVHPIHLDRKSTGVSSALKLIWDLVRLYQLIQPDVVHLVTIKPVLLGGIACRIARVPAVLAAVPGLGYVFIAEGIQSKIRQALVKFLYKRTFRHPNIHYIVQNKDDFAFLSQDLGLDVKNLSLILGSGVNLSEYAYKPLPPEPYIVMMASRLLVDKGVVEFAAAAKMLSTQKNITFVLVGDIDSQNPASLTKEDIEGWVNAGILNWWGFQNNMAATLEKAHIVVLPSYREGLPKVLIEASAIGRAIVTTNAPGCKDAVINNQTGLLVPPKDAKALAFAIEKIIIEGLCEAFGVEGNRFANQQFDIQDVVDKHLSLYKMLIAQQSLANAEKVLEA